MSKRVKLTLDATGCPENYATWYDDNCKRIAGTTHRGFWAIVRKCEKDVAGIPCEKTRKTMVRSIREHHRLSMGW
jgi:hypothetical protein